MSTQTRTVSSALSGSGSQTNGAGAAAILAAGIGAFLLAVLAIVGEKWPTARRFFIFSKPTGPLSGVTTCTIIAWIVVWAVLHARWRKRSVALARINVIAFGLLVLSLLLTFPPIADLF
jgi:hypothetical protein